MRDLRLIAVKTLFLVLAISLLDTLMISSIKGINAVSIKNLESSSLIATGNNLSVQSTNLGCSDATIIITKQLVNPGADTTGRLNDYKFPILIRDITDSNIAAQSIDLNAGQSVTACLTSGHEYNILEAESLLRAETGLAFDVNYSNDCRVTASAGQSPNCTIRNTITAGSSSSGLLIPQGGNTGLVTPSVQTPDLLTPQAGNTLTGTLSDPNNPPFKSCQGNAKSVSRDLPISGGTETDEGKVLISAPSSATYLIEGKISLSKLNSAMNALKTNTFTIQLLSDLDLVSNKITLAPSAPGITGSILVESSNGLKQKIIPFDVKNVRTECKFITLAKNGPTPNANIVPLGQINNKLKTITDPEIKRLAVGGPTVTNDPLLGYPFVLNSPFATCTTADTTRTNSNDDIAIYSIKGITNKKNSLDGNNLIIQITSDLVQNETDLAKFPGGNNPYIQVNLLVDKNRNTAHLIPFTLHSLWTDCKNVALTDSMVFSQFLGETKY